MIVSFLFWSLLCFSSNVEPTIGADRIIGGEPANITDFPYQLAMEVSILPILPIYVFACGASIIRRSWALTAGHCVASIKKSQIRLRSGSSYRMRGGTLHYAEKIIVHPEYYEGEVLKTADYDVAIIKVSTPFHYSEVTQNILMACKTPSPGSEAVVSGWGGVNNLKQLADQLQQLTVTIMGYEECKRTDPYFNLTLTPRFICASVPEGGKNVYYGDSGGPLVVDNILVGIVSYGQETSFQSVLRFPTAYTDVAKIRTWVTESIQHECC